MTEAPIYDGQTLRLSRPLDVTGHRYISMRGVDIAAEEDFEGHALVIMDRGACLNLSRATINTACVPGDGIVGHPDGDVMVRCGNMGEPIAPSPHFEV